MPDGITIIIPTKDRPHGLRVAVNSALDACDHAKQGDVLVVDDRSKLPAKEILSDITAENLTVLKSDRSPGPAGARNFGVDNTSSSTLVFLDDDDAIVKDYLLRILEWRSDPANAANMFGFCAVTGPRTQQTTHLGRAEMIFETPLVTRLFPLSAGVWTDREAFLEVGGLDECLRINEDTDFCLSMASKGYLPCFDPTPGVLINAGRNTTGNGDAGSITKQSRSRERELAFKLILQKHQNLLNANRSLRNQFAARVSKYIARDRGFIDALKFALRQPDGKLKAVVAALAGTLTRNR